MADTRVHGCARISTKEQNESRQIKIERTRCCNFIGEESRVNKMTVNVYSKKAIKELMQEGLFPDNVAVISFYDPPNHRGIDKDYHPVDYTSKTDRVFQVAVHDIDIDILEDYHLTYETYFTEADELAEFIYAAKADRLNIMCQCEYGQSRSAGCAAAILEHFYKTGISIFADYKYYPNQMIFHKVFDALEVEKVKQEG